MGSPDTEIGYPDPYLERFGEHLKKKYGSLRPTNENPQHRVEIAKGFYMSKFEITYGQNAHSIDPDGKVFDPNSEDNQYLYSRGGSWQAGLTYCRSASRWMVESPATSSSSSSIGFRILIEE